MDISGKVTLKKGRSYSIERFHPWIFSGAIQKTDGDIHDGDWVDVLQHNGKLLGTGHFQEGSITVRMLTFGESRPGPDFYTQKLTAALSLRRAAHLPGESTNCFRWIHAEGDGLPGLIVDWYDGAAVVQAHSHGMHANREQIALAIKNVWGENLKSVYYKSQATLSRTRDVHSDGYLYGLSGVPHVVRENQNKFFVDWEEGQKTGFFLDQRENRRLLGHYAKGKKVLNTFCYTGGFSVYAIAEGAEIVHSVDSSEKAITLARKNIELNMFDESNHKCFTSDTFDFIKDKQDQYDVIVLDPPAFAKKRDSRHQAVKGYQRLNAEAIRIIRPGGIIFTFSCSQVVDQQLFYDTVVSASIQAQRNVKVLQHLSQPADHPVSMFHPEGEYLKGLILYVE
ncbi:MAG: class I SAM-dependent rRNA methyltransferase [Chryseolinea sp.]